MLNKQHCLFVNVVALTLCLPDKKVDELELPMMVTHNQSTFQTGFTISIEAKEGVTTVSARDRLTTIQILLFILRASQKSSPLVMSFLYVPKPTTFWKELDIQTQVDLMRLSGLEPYAVLCELTNADGSMSVGSEVENFSIKSGFPIVTIEEIIAYPKVFCQFSKL